MPKPRRKSEIRAAALRKVAVLREAAELRAAFLKPRPRSWHDRFLAALREGEPVAAAARAAGVARSTAHKARANEHGFDAAWRSAYACGLGVRNARRFNDVAERFNVLTLTQAQCEVGPPEVDGVRDRRASARR